MSNQTNTQKMAEVFSENKLLLINSDMQEDYLKYIKSKAIKAQPFEEFRRRTLIMALTDFLNKRNPSRGEIYGISLIYVNLFHEVYSYEDIIKTLESRSHHFRAVDIPRDDLIMKMLIATIQNEFKPRLLLNFLYLDTTL